MMARRDGTDRPPLRAGESIMLRRFNRFTPTARFADMLGARLLGEDVSANYNVGPGQSALVALREQPAALELKPLRWGFVPSWSEDAAIGSRMTNARIETIESKPAYSAAFSSRRCLIPADGYYAWRTQANGRSQPYFVHFKDRQPFCFAGLWSVNERVDTQPVYTFTVVTRDALPCVKELQSRMPLVLTQDYYAAWLDPELTDPQALRTLARDGSRVSLEAYPISRRVDSLRNNDANLIERTAAVG